jgi:hypothetical protein
MAIIRVEEYTCDFCGKLIPLEDVYSGTLAVRKRGTRGRRTEVALSMHIDCIPSPRFPAKPNGAPARRSRVVAQA